MWLYREHYCRGLTKFFRITFLHDTLQNHFETNFALMQHHKYSLSELENMVPWERALYVGMLIQYLEEENEKLKQLKATQKR